MAWLRRAAILGCALAACSAALTCLEPQEAQANPVCDISVSPAAPITGAAGIGNPVGDACDAIADPALDALPNPLDTIKDAAGSLGQGVFDQITTWAADGAVWLLGQVATLTNKTTSPDLLSKGFLRQYRGMASIATVLALLMLLFAVLESLGRGDSGMLIRVFLVNVPLAAIATSAAYVVVQLLIVATDGFSEAIAHSTAQDTRAFFKDAIQGLSAGGALAGTATAGPGAGTAAGAAGVPLFVGFLAAIIAALAAFLVWIELLMRDAAIYAVALFMPMAIAASIWPRWTSALRRTAELLIVIVFSKFVIVSIIALAASLLANTGSKVEQVFAAGALLLLACFAPFVLLRLVPFAEGAVSSAYHRQSAGAASARAARTSTSLQMMRQAAFSNWAAQSSQSAGKSKGGKGSSKGRPGAGGGGGARAGEAAGASGAAAGAVALPSAAGAQALKGTKAAASKLAESGTAQASGAAASGNRSSDSTAGSGRSGGGQSAPRPRAEGNTAGEQTASPAISTTAGPMPASGGEQPSSGAKPPRPASEAGKGTSAAKGKP